MNFSHYFTCWLTHRAKAASKVVVYRLPRWWFYRGACWCMAILRKKRPSMQQLLSLMKASMPFVREPVRQTGLEEEFLFMLSWRLLWEARYVVCIGRRGHGKHGEWVWLFQAVVGSCESILVGLQL